MSKFESFKSFKSIKELNDDMESDLKMDIENPSKDSIEVSDIPQAAKPVNIKSSSSPIISKTLNDTDSKISETLNERIGDEYSAYYFYRNAANWCKNVNYKKASSFFEKEAASELEHSLGIQDYMTKWNLYPSIPQVPTTHEFSSLVDIINKAYELEYNLLQKYSEDQKMLGPLHPATFNFIQKYVNIQNEEVLEYSDFLNALLLIDTNNRLDVLYFEHKYF